MTVDQHGDDPKSSGQNLPFEIWQAIIHHLPRSTLWPLRELNRMLHEVVLDELVRHTHILFLGGWETERAIQLLAMPDFTKRVRYLTIHNQVLLAPSKIRLKLSLPKNLIKTYFSRNKGRQSLNELIRRERYAPKRLLQSFTNIDNLHSIELVGPIDWWHSQHKRWRIGLDRLRDLLHLSSSTLTRLSLVIPLHLLEHFFRVIPQQSKPDVFLPRLEELNLELQKTHELASLQDGTIQHLLGTTIPTFISRHSTLRALSLNAPPSLWQCLPLSPLFLALSSEHSTHLSHLRSFSISNPIVSVGVPDYENTITKEKDALAQFLQRYAKQLTTLQLDLQVHRNAIPFVVPVPPFYNFVLPPPDNWFSHALYSVPFNCLRSLDISLLYYHSCRPRFLRQASVPAFSEYLGLLVERGLRVLKLRDYVFESLEEFQTLLNAFPFQQKDRGLVELDLTLRCISPWILDLLAEKLPALETLGLTFEAWTSEKHVTTLNIVSIAIFNDLMEARDYSSNWPNLRLLRFNFYGYLYPFYSYPKALVKAFPERVLYQTGDSEPLPGRIWAEKGFCQDLSYGPSSGLWL